MLFLHIMIYAVSVLGEGHQLIYNRLIPLLLAEIKENAGVIFGQIRNNTGSELFSCFFLPCSLFVSFFSFRVVISLIDPHGCRRRAVSKISIFQVNTTANTISF